MVDCRSPCGPIVACLDKWEWVVLGDFKAMQSFWGNRGGSALKETLVWPFLRDYSDVLSEAR